MANVTTIQANKHAAGAFGTKNSFLLKEIFEGSHQNPRIFK